MEISGAKSLYISCVVGIFYVTEIDIWAGFEPVSSTEKIICANHEQLLGPGFLKFLKIIWNFFENIVGFAQKSWIE